MALTSSDVSIPVHVHDLVTLVHEWTPPSNVMNVLGLFGVVCLIYLAAWRLNRRPRIRTGEDMMHKDDTKHFRNIRVRAIIADGITDFVEDAVSDAKLTRYEAIDIYNKIGRTFGLSDLLPRRKLKNKLSFGEILHLKQKIMERNPGIQDRIKANNVVTLPKKRIYRG